MEKRQTVLVMAERSAEITAQLAARFGSRCELLFAENEPDFGAALSRADAIIGEPEEVQLQNARALSWLQLTWAGADKYARMARFPAGVTLCNVSGAFGTVISEYVLGSIVALYRALPVYWSQQKAHVWQQHAKGSTICGKRALVFGMGDLGANVARRLSAFGAQVTGVRRTRREALPAGFADAYTMDKADELLPQADIVVNCLPSTPETEGFLTRARLLSMKKGALLVNVGRGSFVKTDDLVFALEKDFLGGAVLDVLETEPLEESSALWDMENVLITPHIAGPSFEGNVDVQSAIWAICMENLDCYLDGKPLRHVVALHQNIAARQKRQLVAVIGILLRERQERRCGGKRGGAEVCLCAARGVPRLYHEAEQQHNPDGGQNGICDFFRDAAFRPAGVFLCMLDAPAGLQVIPEFPEPAPVAYRAEGLHKGNEQKRQKPERAECYYAQKQRRQTKRKQQDRIDEQIIEGHKDPVRERTLHAPE